MSAPNRPSALRFMCTKLYPGLDPPDFGYIGKTMKRVGGPGILCELLWRQNSFKPKGDLMAYLYEVWKNGRDKNTKPKPKTVEVPVIEGFLERPLPDV